MILLSQFKDKTTQSLELNVEEIEISKNIVIPKEIYEKYKKITKKERDFLSIKDLKGLGELMEKNLVRQVYSIVENNSKRIFGIYTTKQKAIEELKNIIKNPDFYEMQADLNIEIEIF